MGAGGSALGQSARLRDRAARLRDEAQARLEQAETLERSAAAWDKGWQGEQLVGAQLDLLRADGWHVLHDVRWPKRPRANIDHVAVGPGGVLVVDAKNWSGELTVVGGRLRQDRSPRDREVTAVAEAGRAVAGQLDLPWALHVIPVLCATTPVSGGSQRLGETTVLGAQDLVAWAQAASAAADRRRCRLRGGATHRGTAFGGRSRLVRRWAQGFRPPGASRRRATPVAGAPGQPRTGACSSPGRAGRE